MKNGTYTVSFSVDLKGCETQEDAQRKLIALLVDSIEQEDVEFPEVSFLLTEEHEIDYHTDENDVEELSFGEVG